MQFIYSINKNELFLARDKYGIGLSIILVIDFVFASEIKCILKYSQEKIIFQKSLAQTCFGQILVIQLLLIKLRSCLQVIFEI